ncbi:MAG: hypothetical protein JOZ96_17355 [Acidobacteria bacterium]|nr:hypothetical protein [Acidobacteriota bacterium]
MPVNESSATALIRFTGLGIICFNRDKQRGEIAAIRDNKHALSIRIQRPVFQEGSGNDVVVYQDVATYQALPKEGVQVEIKARGRAPVEGFDVYQSGEFDRLGSPDVNDFRWIVNMNSLHGDAPLDPAPKGRYPITKIYIGNALFYTHRLDTNLFFEKVERDASGAETGREVFGNVGETIGAKIEGDEVSFTIRGAGGGEETHTLNRVEGLPFRIEFKNMDYSDNAVYSDMDDYYSYVSNPGDKQFDLAPVVEEGGETADGGSYNQEEFCHPITWELDSIDEL